MVFTQGQGGVDQQGDAGPPDVVGGEVHILAAEPGAEEVLNGQTRRAELCGGEHEAETEDNVG